MSRRADGNTAARFDLRSIVDHISDNNPQAARALVDQIEMRADRLSDNPKMGRPGRIAGTRELVVHPNYMLVYAESFGIVTILRVLHAARQWP